MLRYILDQCPQYSTTKEEFGQMSVRVEVRALTAEWPEDWKENCPIFGNVAKTLAKTLAKTPTN